MKTLNKILMPMSLAYLMAISQLGCAQNNTGENMDKTMAGPATEMTGQKMDTPLETMKGDTMQGNMGGTEEQKMKDSSKEMMK